MDEERRKNLRLIREGTNWDEIEALEVKLLREETPQEGMKGFAALRREFNSWLERDDALFRSDYEERLAQIQERLRKLDKKKGAKVDDIIESLVDLQKVLDDAGIPSAVIGGIAIGAWGKARLTRDGDIKILLRREEHKRLLDLLKDYRPLHANPANALRQNGIVFVQDSRQVRIDIMLADTKFDETLIARARQVEINSCSLRVCSPEDLIVLKIIALRPQDQFDVIGIVQKQSDVLDYAYITKWLKDFEKLIDDSTLVREFTRIKEKYAK